MRFYIDRSLPVTIAAQLQGQIEYGVAFGSIPHGAQLPSVRALATELEVSPVTIPHVYRALISRGVLVAEQGRGTFVSGRSNVDPNVLAKVRTRIDALVDDADAAGIPRSELRHLVAARIDAPARDLDLLTIVFVGNFRAASEAYVRDLEASAKAFLRPSQRIGVCTVDGLVEGGRDLERARSADLVVTLAHRLPDVRRAVGDGPVIAVLDFEPSEATLKRLASLPAGTRVALVSTYPQFLTPLKQKVLEAAPNVDLVTATTRDAIDRTLVPGTIDVVVYTTGADGVVEGLPQGVTTIEFRYTPDPRSIEHDFVALLRSMQRHRSDEVRPDPG